MTVSRRSFLRTVGAGSAALAFPTSIPFVTARGREAAAAEPGLRRAASGEIRLDSNENPYGPAREALEAMHEMFGESCRYPDWTSDQLKAAIATHLRVPEDHILLGSGSGEILRLSVDAFTSRSRGLVTAAPTFELPADRAKVLDVPVTAIPVDHGLRLDLERMAAAAGPAGLVFLCNPNNPTGTVHGDGAMRQTIERILRASPEVLVLVDEAYHEYVTDPSYRTLVPLALTEPRVIVSRTFSKVYGMAGLRAGYAVARPEALARMAAHALPNNVNVLVSAAASASLGVPGHAAREKAKNTEARAFTRTFFESAGFAVAPSETNFLMIDIKRDIKDFRERCRARGVMVGRPFPPLTTHLRVSIGMMEEMQRATAIFRELL
jgi:histidinol-phosphate aminotransferase